MKHEEVQIPILEKEALMGDCLTEFGDISKETNPYKVQILLCEFIERTYKRGYVAGFHQADGNKILNTVKPDTE